MVSQGIQAGTPEIRMEPPNYSGNSNLSMTQQAVSNLADHLPLSFEDKQKFM